MMRTVAGKWARLVSSRPPAPALRLLCFPYAGSGASIYADWQLPENLAAEVWAIQPPGRENRRTEPMPRTLDELVEAYAEHLTPLFDLPFAFFGHSFGALSAFEFARLLRRHGAPQPTHLFLSGYAAPHRPPRREPISTLPDDQFVHRMLEIAGTSPSAIRDPQLLLFYAPLTRADCRLLEQHQYALQAPLEIPITCFAAVDDCEMEVADVAAWDRHTGRSCRLSRYRGGHLFLRDHQHRLLAEIAAELSPVSRACGAARALPDPPETESPDWTVTTPRLAPDSSAWNEALAVHVVGGQVAAATLAAAFNQVVSRHPALRTRFPLVHGEVSAVVEPPEQLALEVPVRGPWHALWTDDLCAIAGRPFDPAHELPVRASLLRHRADTVVLVLHRLAGPGWTVERLYRELAECYTALATGEQGRDGAAATRPASRDTATHPDLLGRVVPIGARLAIGRADPPHPSSSAAMLTHPLGPSAYAAVRKLVHQFRATEATVLLTGYLALLAYHEDGADPPMSEPAAAELVSTAPNVGGFLRHVRVDVQNSFGRLAAGLSDHHRDAGGHAAPGPAMPGPDPSLAQPSLPRHVFRHRPADVTGYAPLGGLRAKTTPVDTGHSRHDLEFLVDSEPGRITVRAVYRTDIFALADVRALVQRYDALLCQAGEEPDRPLANLDWWSSADRAMVAGARRTEPRATIHDRHGRPLPPGVRGELYLDGSPTGEASRWTHDGRLERVGRRSRVKVDSMGSLVNRPAA